MIKNVPMTVVDKPGAGAAIIDVGSVPFMTGYGGLAVEDQTCGGCGNIIAASLTREQLKNNVQLAPGTLFKCGECGSLNRP